MSKIGIVAAASKNGREIFEEAMKARSNLLLPREGRIALPFQTLIESNIRRAYGVELDVREDDDPELSGAFAAYNYKDSCLKIKHSVYLKLSLEEAEACFTICHEIGHIHMHSNPSLFRRVSPNQLPAKSCDPEAQADRFAREFMVDRSYLKKNQATPESVARYFRIPQREIRLLISELKADGVIDLPKRMDGNAYWEAQQADFDF